MANALITLSPRELEFHEIAFKDLALYNYGYNYNYPEVAATQRAELRRLPANERAGGLYPVHGMIDEHVKSTTPPRPSSRAITCPKGVLLQGPPFSFTLIDPKPLKDSAGWLHYAVNRCK